MCRLIAYLGSEILLNEILVKPVNSIVMQSLHARESTVPTNGDGFGLGWYVPQLAEEPALFRSIFPAWNDQNLLHLTSKIQSGCFFAHVRAASVGGANNDNCHPFLRGRHLLMHNGQIQDFIAIKRHLRHMLDDDIYNWIKGDTDSEHLFALFMQLAKGKKLDSLSVVADILQQTFGEIERLITQFGQPGPSYYNICMTDGKRIVATRYCTDPDIVPESMHYWSGKYFSSEPGPVHQKKSNSHECVLVSSEHLTDVSLNWNEVPANHFLLVDSEHRIRLLPISI